MKKLTVLFSALLMLGATASFAGDKKGKKSSSCCKGKTEQCSKDKKEACDKGRGCCQKGGNKGTATSSSTTTTTTTSR